MRAPFESAIAANRFGLGARPGELAGIGSEARAWLHGQLRGAPPALGDAALRPSQDILAQALELRAEQRAQRRAAVGMSGAEVETPQRLPQLLRPVYVSEVTARLRATVASERPFLERLTQF